MDHVDNKTLVQIVTSFNVLTFLLVFQFVTGSYADILIGVCLCMAWNMVTTTFIPDKKMHLVGLILLADILTVVLLIPMLFHTKYFGLQKNSARSPIRTSDVPLLMYGRMTQFQFYDAHLDEQYIDTIPLDTMTNHGYQYEWYCVSPLFASKRSYNETEELVAWMVCNTACHDKRDPCVSDMLTKNITYARSIDIYGNKKTMIVHKMLEKHKEIGKDESISKTFLEPIKRYNVEKYEEYASAWNYFFYISLVLAAITYGICACEMKTFLDSEEQKTYQSNTQTPPIRQPQAETKEKSA